MGWPDETYPFLDMKPKPSDIGEDDIDRNRDRSTFHSVFKLGDIVQIDGGDQQGTVIGFCFYTHDSQVLVSWWNSGALVEQWIGAWRLTFLKEAK
jgi:hypothetical protein